MHKGYFLGTRYWVRLSIAMDKRIWEKGRKKTDSRGCFTEIIFSDLLAGYCPVEDLDESGTEA
jgi:hypothetical protein